MGHDIQSIEYISYIELDNGAITPNILKPDSAKMYIDENGDLY